MLFSGYFQAYFLHNQKRYNPIEFPSFSHNNPFVRPGSTFFSTQLALPLQLPGIRDGLRWTRKEWSRNRKSTSKGWKKSVSIRRKKLLLTMACYICWPGGRSSAFEFTLAHSRWLPCGRFYCAVLIWNIETFISSQTFSSNVLCCRREKRERKRRPLNDSSDDLWKECYYAIGVEWTTNGKDGRVDIKKVRRELNNSIFQHTIWFNSDLRLLLMFLHWTLHSDTHCDSCIVLLPISTPIDDWIHMVNPKRRKTEATRRKKQA